MQGNKITYALIGSGKHALSCIIPAMRESYNSDLKIISNSRSLQDADQSIVGNIPISSMSIMRDFMEEIGGVDVVYISSPNSTHADLVCEALRTGRHVICEKPLAYRISEVNKIESLLETNPRLKLCTGFMYRLHPQYEMIRALLEGVIVYEVKGVFTYNLDPEIENIRQSESLGGGALLDVGCYLLDVVRYLFNAKELNLEIDAKMDQIKSIDRECVLRGDLEWNNSRVGLSLFASQQAQRQQQITIRTEKMDIIISSPFLIPRGKKVALTIKHKNRGKSDQNIIFQPFNHYTAQINLFSEGILRGVLMSPLTDGLVNARDLCSFWSDINS